MDFQQKIGAIPSQKIREMIKKNCIKNADEKNIQPASLDLAISDEAYQMKGTFLPRLGEKIQDIVRNGISRRIDLSQPFEKNKIYWIKLQEELNLQKEFFAVSSNKSSTGRINIQARLLADGVPRFDRIHSRYCKNSNSYQGSLWIEIIPRSFSIKLTPGDKLNQLRFFNNCSRLSIRELKNTYLKYQLLFGKDGNFIQGKEVKIRDDDATLILSVDLLNNKKIIGYKAISSDKILEFNRIKYYAPEDFFEPIFAPENGYLILEKNEFYIFSTKEFVRVPSNLAAEMIAYDISSGEFRSHYAGFFDPGFGYGKNGEIKGTPAVLEVRAFDNNFILRDGQPICKMVYDKLSEQPDLIYGEKNLGSHYAFQRGPKLSKHFKA
jgi:dCTP deaminase